MIFLILEGFPVGSLEANCYIIGDEDTRKAAVVDPGGDAQRILRTLQKLNLNCIYIILTHAHFDHIGDLDKVQKATKAQVLIHADDAKALHNPRRNFSFFAGSSSSYPEPDRLLRDKDTVELGKTIIEVLHTPGHTPGGISLKVGDNLITGDTLFAGSVGRSDFPGGSHQQLIKSIKEKLLPYPPETKVWPGHGPGSTIGHESRYNPFLNGQW